VNETIVLNPREFIPELTEVGLDELGLAVRAEGADWGESQVQAQMIRRASGESPVDPHRGNVEMSLPIMVKEEGEVPLAEAAHRLQAAAARIGDEQGSWIRRDFDDEGGFAGSIAYRVYTPALAGLQGWLWAHRRHAPDVTLKLSRSPICYAVVEETSRTFSETTERELVDELAEVLGTAPGLIRVTVTADIDPALIWRGAILAIESRDHPQNATADTTAALAYEAEDLTPLGDTAIATRSGASGGGSNDIIRHSNLSNAWQAILGFEIDGVGHMTHVGTRRIKARIFDPGSNPGEVELRLEWRALGQSRWTPNRIVPTPLTGDFALIDLGECRLDEATLGDQRWEGRLTARTTGTAGAAIEVDKIWPLPTEQYLTVREPIELVTPTLLEAWSSFNNESGAITGDTLDDGTNRWTEFADSDAGDFSESGGQALRREVSDTGTISARLGLAGRAIGVSAGSGSDTAAEVTFSHSEAVRGVESGLMLRASSPSSLGLSVRYICGDPSGTTSTIEVAAAATVVDSFTVPLIDPPSHRLTVLLVGQNALIYLDGQLVRVSSAIVASGPDGVYIYDEQAGATACERTYKSFSAWVPETDALCFGGRDIEFRSDGVFRQDATDDIWGRVVPEGVNLPYAPPSGLEARTARFIVLPSSGDLDQLDDGQTNRMSATVSYFPGYLFAREALAA
jgi:hypothetical protein